LISSQTSYRLDNGTYDGGAKEGDEQEVALHRRKTTTKRSQRREHDKLPHPRVHLQDTFHFALILQAPRPTVLRRDGSGLGTTRGWVMARRAQNDPIRKPAAYHRNFIAAASQISRGFLYLTERPVEQAHRQRRPY
jgi:hypothetical protein